MRRAFIVCCLAGLVPGCGFHLRTWDLGTNVSSVYVQADQFNLLADPLRRALRQAGVEAAQTAGDAELVVELLAQRRERRSVSVTGRARAAEYEMLLAVRYQVLDAGGVKLVAPQWVQSERVFRVDRDNIVGSSEEQALLEREMQGDLIQGIVRSMDAALGARSSTGAG